MAVDNCAYALSHSVQLKGSTEMGFWADQVSSSSGLRIALIIKINGTFGGQRHVQIK